MKKVTWSLECSWKSSTNERTRTTTTSQADDDPRWKQLRPTASPLNPLTPGKGEISLPHRRAIFSKLKNEDKDLFLLEIVRNDVKKHKMQLFPLRSHLT